jgi:thioredoxin reductase (NADPH)
LHGKLKLYETSKQELLDIWIEVLGKNNIEIKENKKVDSITKENEGFRVNIKDGTEYSTHRVLFAIGRRGTPRKLNIPGEVSTKVAYRLLEPELITGKNVIVVGGGDSAIESAILLADENKVTLSYRSAAFSRLKPRNKQKLDELISEGKLNVLLNSNLISIEEKYVNINIGENEEPLQLENDLVYIFAGGELPTQFLRNAGIEIATRYGEAILKHEK